MSSFINISNTSENKELRYIPKDNSTIEYGALAQNIEGHGEKTFYLTTAIAYTNGYPHMGHAYEVFFLLK